MLEKKYIGIPFLFSLLVVLVKKYTGIHVYLRTYKHKSNYNSIKHKYAPQLLHPHNSTYQSKFIKETLKVWPPFCTCHADDIVLTGNTFHSLRVTESESKLGLCNIYMYIYDTAVTGNTIHGLRGTVSESKIGLSICVCACERRQLANSSEINNGGYFTIRTCKIRIYIYICDNQEI